MEQKGRQNYVQDAQKWVSREGGKEEKKVHSKGASLLFCSRSSVLPSLYILGEK